MTYTIKPLEWVQETQISDGMPIEIAKTKWGKFITLKTLDGDFMAVSPRGIIGGGEARFTSMEAAKDAAAARYTELVAELLEPATALQATQYVLAKDEAIIYSIDFNWPSLTWYVSRGFVTMHRQTGEWSVNAPLFAPEYAFDTPAEAAECFYKFHPHMKPQPQQ